MGWVLLETSQTQHGPTLQHLPPPPPPPHGVLDSNISPSILLIIVILSVIFFISGLLHLLVRLLLRPASRDPEDPDNATALQGPLQQLFHLHDSGVDQSFIDALPVFLYRAIVGAKDPFDCAVCLCEFDADDKLRLLPACSHAFHVECIDTWLLSHSTCPLCRSSLLPPEFSPAGGGCAPAVVVLESAGESSREIVADRESLATALVEVDPTGDGPQKTGEVGPKEETGVTVAEASPEPPAKVVPVKLGKFRNVDAAAAAGVGEGTSNGGKVDERRCFSMGSFEYVMDEASVLHVAIKPPARKPGRRLAMSECDCHSRREGFKGFEPPGSGAVPRGGTGGSGIGAGSRRTESFSVSKIWLRSSKKKKAAAEDASRRASSFRLPMQGGGETAEEPTVRGGSSRRTAAEEAAAAAAAASWWEKSGSEFSFDVEAGSCDGSVLSPAEETPSFARRTLLWVVGRHHKVGNHI